MTVCLAALCCEENQSYAVVAADRMVTLGSFMEFEHGVPKMAHPSSQAIVMVAGDTLVGTRLAREVSAALTGATPRTSEIARHMANQYQNVRREALETQILAPRALNLGSFYGGHASFNPQMTMMLDQAMSQFNLGVELLLAGVDGDGGHLFSIHNPGGAELQHDVIGYAAIGSGTIHALQSMVGFRHTSSAGLNETIFRTYASKRRSEVAPGVGLDTDMAIISLAGVEWVTSEQQQRLSDLYATYQNQAMDNLVDEMADFRQPSEELNKGGSQDGADG